MDSFRVWPFYRRVVRPWPPGTRSRSGRRHGVPKKSHNGDPVSLVKTEKDILYSQERGREGVIVKKAFRHLSLYHCAQMTLRICFWR